MPGMPHVMEVGALFSQLSIDYSNFTPERRMEELDHLYTSTRVVPALNGNPTGSGAMKSEDLEKPGSTSDGKTTQRTRRIDHINRHWFGLLPNEKPLAEGEQPADEPPPTDSFEPKQPTGVTTTGWWNQWLGDAHGIFRETLIRALEISLGLPHNARGYPETDTQWEALEQDLSTLKPWPEPTRCLPIQFQWFCPSPKFEGWITWRKTDATTISNSLLCQAAEWLWKTLCKADGVVSVTFATPGTEVNPLSLTLLAEDYDAGTEPRLVHDERPYDKPDELDPVYTVTEPWIGYHDTASSGPGQYVDSQANKGSVVIGHARTEQVPPPVSKIQPHKAPLEHWALGDLPAESVLDGTGSRIVCVAPAQNLDGGLRPDDIRFE